MKLIRVGEKGREKPGLWMEDGRRLDISAYFQDYDPNFFKMSRWLDCQVWDKEELNRLPEFESTERLGSPISSPGKIICIGLNFSDHAEESGMPIPEEPVVFFKSPTSLSGPNDPIVYPVHASKLDWEVEFAIVIGRESSYISPDQAMESVFGYCLHNDVSERNYQLERSGQWVKGKSCDSFAPLGPFLVTKEEIEDINNLSMELSVNGKIMQQGHTGKLIFGVEQVVSYLSHVMTLMPGDVISMGTPPGVGLGMSPPVFLNPGDVVELSVEKMGSSRQEVVCHEKADTLEKLSLTDTLKPLS